jgi:hypothetical protein
MNLISKFNSIHTALETVAAVLQPMTGLWLVGGSCGLLLNGLELAKHPRDLDLYMDGELLPEAYGLLHPLAIDEPLFSETVIYRSHLSHYRVKDITVELVGSFQVRVFGASYDVRVNDTLRQFSPMVVVGQEAVYTTPLAHELVFNVLRQRPDRYAPIAEKMKTDAQTHMPAMLRIVESNFFDNRYMTMFGALLDYSF